VREALLSDGQVMGVGAVGAEPCTQLGVLNGEKRSTSDFTAAVDSHVVGSELGLCSASAFGSKLRIASASCAPALVGGVAVAHGSSSKQALLGSLDVSDEIGSDIGIPFDSERSVRRGPRLRQIDPGELWCEVRELTAVQAVQGRKFPHTAPPLTPKPFLASRRPVVSLSTRPSALAFASEHRTRGQ
jgi:hypothetical protein